MVHVSSKYHYSSVILSEVRDGPFETSVKGHFQRIIGWDFVRTRTQLYFQKCGFTYFTLFFDSFITYKYLLILYRSTILYAKFKSRINNKYFITKE